MTFAGTTNSDRKWQFNVDYPTPTIDLPLTPIRWDTPTTPNDIAVGKPWPPLDQDQRLNRLAVYRRIHTGDLTDLVTPTLPGAINYIESAVSTVTDLVTATDIAIEPNLDGLDSRQVALAAAELVTDILRFGGGWVHAALRPDTELALTSPDPAQVFRLEDGSMLMGTELASGSRVVLESLVDGVSVIRVHDRNRDTKILGRQINEVDGGEGALVSVVGIPRIPGWGTAYVDGLLAPAVRANLRDVSVDAIADAHEHPLLAVWMDPEDYDAFARGDVLDEDRNQAVTQGLADWRGHQIAAVANQQQRLEYVTWDGQLSVSQAQAARYAALVWQMAGIPPTLIQTAGIPSGVALRRLALRLWARTRSLVADASAGLSASLSAVTGVKVAVEWPTAFDLLEDEDASL